MQHGLRISGRHNALGTIFVRRRFAWTSGTQPLFDFVFESNTHTGPSFRVPLTAKNTRVSEGLRTLSGEHQETDPLAQRAAKQMVGYFTGHIV